MTTLTYLTPLTKRVSLALQLPSPLTGVVGVGLTGTGVTGGAGGAGGAIGAGTEPLPFGQRKDFEDFSSERD